MLYRHSIHTFYVPITFFFSENRAVYEIKSKNNVERGRLQMTIWRTPIACRVTKATDTHSEYVILSAFLMQQWLNERGSMLRHTYLASLVPSHLGLCSFNC
jgi:hypothetical protein